MSDSFSTRASLSVNGRDYTYYSLPKLGERFDLKRLPFSMKILLENLLRHEDGVTVLPGHVEAVAQWDPKAEPDTEIAFMPARVLVQGNPVYLGRPDVVGEVRATLLAAVRAAVLWRQLGGGYLDFLFARRSMANAAREWLRTAS